MRASLYTILQMLSVTLVDKAPIYQLLGTKAGAALACPRS
jgi:hypothetical protein